MAKESVGTDLAVRVEDAARKIGIPVGLIEGPGTGTTMDEILLALAAAPDLKSALNASKVEPLTDFAGQVLRFKAVKWQPSEFENEDSGARLPYAVIEATDMLEVRHVVTSGASKVVLTLGIAAREDAFPFEAKVDVKELDNGRRVVSLVATN